MTFSIGKFCYFRRDHPNNKSVHKTITYLCSRNQLVKLNDGRFISSRKINEIKAKVRAHITTNGELTIQDAKGILGQGRNRGIPILDYLDTIGLTMRVGNARVLR